MSYKSEFYPRDGHTLTDSHFLLCIDEYPNGVKAPGYNMISVKVNTHDNLPPAMLRLLNDEIASLLQDIRQELQFQEDTNSRLLTEETT